jgi:uncharacterized membrane protein
VKHLQVYPSLLAFLALSALPVHAVTLEFIGPGSGFQDVSENGTKVLLWTWFDANAYLWTAQDGLTPIGTSDPNSPIYEISWDGTTVVGTLPDGSVENQEASIWTEEEDWQGLGGFPVGFCDAGLGLSSGWGISADGSVAVGLSSYLEDGYCRARAFRWSEATGMVPLQVTNTHRQSRASAVSGDGRIAVGWTETDFGTWRPTRWRADGSEHLLYADPEYFSEALGVNEDGSVVVGELEQRAFRWVEGVGLQNLGLVPGDPGTYSRAVGVSADGSSVVGWGGNGPSGFLWTADGGMRNLNQIVEDAGYDLGPRWISHATAISANGNTIVGAVFDPATFLFEAFRLQIGPPVIPGIPNGTDPAEGDPLRMIRLEDDQVRLIWSETCLGDLVDYGVYEGALGDFTSHTRKLCGTLNGAPRATLTPLAGDAYYLVVPFDGDYEASYGQASNGVERPVGQLTCAPQQTYGFGSCQ